MHIKVTPGLRRHHNKKGKPHWKSGKKFKKSPSWLLDTDIIC